MKYINKKGKFEQGDFYGEIHQAARIVCGKKEDTDAGNGFACIFCWRFLGIVGLPAAIGRRAPSSFCCSSE
jgi:hypothetical protein